MNRKRNSFKLYSESYYKRKFSVKINWTHLNFLIKFLKPFIIADQAIKNQKFSASNNMLKVVCVLKFFNLVARCDSLKSFKVFFTMAMSFKL